MEHVHLKTGWKTVLALLASLFFVLDISAQEITVQGTVKDTYGEPVTGANVIITARKYLLITELKSM